jgi:biotin carboxyl carrier protein
MKKATKIQEIIEAPIPGKIVVGNITTKNTIETVKMKNPMVLSVKDSGKEVLVSSNTIVRTDNKLAVIEY